MIVSVLIVLYISDFSVTETMIVPYSLLIIGLTQRSDPEFLKFNGSLLS
jgi:hypothetical protein